MCSVMQYALVLSPIASAIEEMLPATASRVAYMPLPGGPNEVQHLQRCASCAFTPYTYTLSGHVCCCCRRRCMKVV